MYMASLIYYKSVSQESVSLKQYGIPALMWPYKLFVVIIIILQMVYKHLSFSREDTSSNVLNQIASKILSKYSSYFFADKKIITVSDPTKISSLKMTPKM